MLTKRQTTRDAYNPIRGLTMARLVAMEDSAERGQYADLQWFYHHMERSNVTIQSAMSRRLAFLDAVDWEIRQVENADPTLANEQADFLRYTYDRIAIFKEASRFLASSLFRSYAHLEKAFTGYGNLVARLKPIEPWFWVRQNRFAPWQFNPDSHSVNNAGQPVDRRNFVILEAPALHRAIARHFFSKALAFADWDIALETCAN